MLTLGIFFGKVRLRSNMNLRCLSLLPSGLALNYSNTTSCTQGLDFKIVLSLKFSNLKGWIYNYPDTISLMEIVP